MYSAKYQKITLSNQNVDIKGTQNGGWTGERNISFTNYIRGVGACLKSGVIIHSMVSSLFFLTLSYLILISVTSKSLVCIL